MGGRVIFYENIGNGFVEHIIDIVDYGDGIDVEDMDLDGDLDFVVCFYGDSIFDSTLDGSIRLYENLGGGNFRLGWADSINPADADLPFIVDIDKDSCPDILMTDPKKEELVLYRQICPPKVEEERKETIRMKVLPNPGVKGIVFLTKGEGDLKIYDVSGKLVYEKKITTGKVRRESKKEGVYFYKIITPGKIEKGKFVIVK